ncbi:MAG TPA: LapA family protein [Solirubrobacterales bacterium]|nr:LapA family protein [Solirubrobacterales bacterium]
MTPEKKPVNWRAWIVGVLVALVVIVCLQNSQQVSVEVLSASFNAPLIVVLLIAVAVGALIGYIAPLVRRHRRDGRIQANGLEEKT